MLSDYFKLALGSLLHRRLRSWLTMIGIFIGIAAVVSLISLGQGMQAAIMQQFAALGGNTVTVQPAGGGFGPPGTLSANNITEDDLSQVQRVPGVSRAFGRLVRAVEIKFNDKVEFTFIGTFPPETEDRDFIMTFRNMNIMDGRMLEKGDTFKVVVGNRYAQDNRFGRPLKPGDKVLINDVDVEVIGILERSGSPEVEGSFFINEDPLRKIIDVDKEYDAILAKTSEGSEVNQVAESIERRLRNFRDLDEGDEDFVVSTSQDIIDTFSNVLLIVQIVLIGIAGISLFVGGIGITNTMYTSVIERTKEIGVMKAIGARNSDVMVIFLFESGLLGLTGGAIGIAIGIGLSKLVEAAAYAGGFDLLQAYFPPTLIIGALAFSFVIGTISGVFPAIRAAKLDPVEALRK